MAAHNPETKAKILEAAAKVIVARGLAAASIVEIRKAAAVSNGSFYCAFANRTEILDLLLQTIRSSREPCLSEAVRRRSRSPRQTLGDIVQAHLQWRADNPALARLRDVMVHGLATEDPVRHAAALAREIELLTGWVTPLATQGTLKSLSGPLLLAFLFGNADAVERDWSSGAARDVAAVLPCLVEAAWATIRVPAGDARTAPPSLPRETKPARLKGARSPTPDLFDTPTETVAGQAG